MFSATYTTEHFKVVVEPRRHQRRCHLYKIGEEKNKCRHSSRYPPFHKRKVTNKPMVPIFTCETQVFHKCDVGASCCWVCKVWLDSAKGVFEEFLYNRIKVLEIGGQEGNVSGSIKSSKEDGETYQSLESLLNIISRWEYFQCVLL